MNIQIYLLEDADVDICALSLNLHAIGIFGLVCRDQRAMIPVDQELNVIRLNKP